MNQKTISITRDKSPGPNFGLLSQVRLFGLPLSLFGILASVVLIAHVTDTLPNNIVGGFLPRVNEADFRASEVGMHIEY